MTVKPIFFDNFKCIAAACPDTCCQGWEIDVDGDTLELYSSLEGDVGTFVQNKLIHHSDGVKLCLEGERCRFLREDNLCEMIIRLGGESLCDICREHPRFYSESDGVCEVGVGLCCPEAARLWLSSPSEFAFNDDGYEPSEEEKASLSRQMKVIEYLTGGEGTLGERLYALLGGGDCGREAYEKLRELYSTLEALDGNFCGSFPQNIPYQSDTRYSRLAPYFIFRYWFLLGEKLCIKFTSASLVMIAAMGGELEVSAKNYSKEVEYDTDNLERIYELLDNIDGLGALCRNVFSR